MVSRKGYLYLILGSLVWNASALADDGDAEISAAETAALNIIRDLPAEKEADGIPMERPAVQPRVAAQDSTYEEPKPAQPPAAPVVKRPNSRFEIGGNYAYVTFKPHGFSSFHGNLGGAQVLWEYRALYALYAGAKFTWREGSMHGSGGRRTLNYIDAQERLGYTLSFFDDSWLLTLFSGFGYRHQDQHLKPKTGSSLRFNYNEFYVPVGLMTDYVVDSLFTIGLGFTWMPQVMPTVTISPLKGARWILTKSLDNFFVEVPMTFNVTDDRMFSVTVNPFYEYWRDGHSTAVTATGIPLGLPGNTYNFWGVEANFSFHF